MEGDASDWWFHGLKILGHDMVTTYEEFTRILVNRFDIRDPNMSFKDLSQLKQSGTPNAYIAEFQKVVFMVKDVSEAKLFLLFT